MADAARRTTGRAELSGRHGFLEVSPEVGVLDEDAFDDLLADDPDAALGLLADLVGATDPSLRALAASLAGRITTEVARSGPAPRPGRGVGRLTRRRASQADGELDLDASMEAVLNSRALGLGLATAAVVASAIVLSRPADASVLAVAREALVLRSQGSDRSAEQVVGDLLVLRGHGVTDLSLALDAAAVQLARSNARRKVCVLLSDCRSTAGPPPAEAARRLDELAILVPADDSADAEALGRHHPQRPPRAARRAPRRSGGRAAGARLSSARR